MPFNQLTGHVIADIAYRLKQVDASSQMEEHGLIDYDLVLGSGTGLGQINDNWYAERTFTSSDSVDLSSLSLKRFGKTFTTSFLGASTSGNIKGVKVDNLNPENLYISLPFNGFSGNYIVPPTGSLVISNRNGWNISQSGNHNLIISGDSAVTSKRYNVGFLGCGIPGVITVENQFNFDYCLTGDFLGSGDIPYESLISGVSTGVLPYEYNLQSAAFSGIFPIDYSMGTQFSGGSGLNSGVLNLDWSSMSGFDTMFSIEYSGYANGGSGGREYLINPGFDEGYVSSSSVITHPLGTNSGLENPDRLSFDPTSPYYIYAPYTLDNPCDPIVGLPGWTTSGNIVTSDAINRNRPPEYYNPNDKFIIIGGNSNENTRIAMCKWPSVQINGHWDLPSLMKQTVPVVSGQTYALTYNIIDGNASTYGVDTNYFNHGTPNPVIRMYSGSGSVIGEQVITKDMLNNLSTSPQGSVVAIATDDLITIEISCARSIMGEVSSLTIGKDAYTKNMITLSRIS